MERIVYEEKLNKDDERLLNPYEYFTKLKGKINDMDNEKLEQAYKNALKLAAIYRSTGQKKGLRKLTFHIQSILKEKEVINAGITKFVYKDDIEEYIQEVSKKQVVILDIANYERLIPEDIVEKMLKVKDLFDEFYVVTTDYQGKLSKQVQKERREKDPILFGVFLNRDKQAINERFYYIGDWVDEYCDLTLDKMVSEIKEVKGKNIVNEIAFPETQDELVKQLDELQLNEESIGEDIKITLIARDSELSNKKEKQGFISNIKKIMKLYKEE